MQRSSEADAASTAGYSKWIDDCEKSCFSIWNSKINPAWLCKWKSKTWSTSWCTKISDWWWRRGGGCAQVGCTTTSVKIYFDQLEEVLEQNNLRNSPSFIFNANESGMTLQYHIGKRIAVKGQKHVNDIISGWKVQITVLECVSASGYSLPHKRKGLANQRWAAWYNIRIGWMVNSQLFHYLFLKYAPSSRPIILLY